jgi:hypothetical protein
MENLKSGGRTRICGVLTRIYGSKTVDPIFFVVLKIRIRRRRRRKSLLSTAATITKSF